MRKLIFMVIFLVTLLMIVGCGYSDKASATVIVVDDTKINDNSDIEQNTEGELKEFNLKAKQWDFEPGTINVNEGDKVVLNIESEDVKHGISIPDFGVSEELVPGELVKIEFVANKKGEFRFFCNIQCGEGHGNMNGKIIVN